MTVAGCRWLDALMVVLAAETGAAVKVVVEVVVVVMVEVVLVTVMWEGDQRSI
ncbi:hypothetical protein E2C01_061542 [Portunus trituberculatus]|uniref:Uncharacterized protein n=1 Tax=Portunus trituberculatus TaxID=210409 RepID=A0A5B7HEN8_PORTR|nr:hypothetical protein [Portunus trituberculatus]